MSEELDLSKAITEVQQMLSSEDGQNQIGELIKKLTGGEEKDSEEQNTLNDSDGSFDMFSKMGDMATILKIKGIMESLNSGKNDHDAAFLNSIKPFLKEERRKKLDSAAKVLTLTKAIKVFKDLGIGGV